MSLRQAALYQDYTTVVTPIVYSDWDADMIHGCVCDEGWEGSDCSRRSCPRGDDPLTPGSDEVQIIDCTCFACSGGFYFTFKNRKTSFIPYNAGAEVLAYRLQVPVLMRRQYYLFAAATRLISVSNAGIL
jgi:hypothetical protein